MSSTGPFHVPPAAGLAWAAWIAACAAALAWYGGTEASASEGPTDPRPEVSWVGAGE